MEKVNVPEMAGVLMAMAEFIWRFRKESTFMGGMFDELEKYKGKFQSASGTKIKICEVGTRNDFSSDGTWKSIAEKIEKLTAQKNY